METLERIGEILGNVVNALAQGMERALTSLFGSSNARLLKKLQPRVAAINALEQKYQAMRDEELRGQTELFRRRLAAGETLDDILVEAFAVCREGGRRFLAMRHFDVQLLGGMVLHSGAIAEMATGEGKTLVATLPAYLNALTGKGVHVVTVNDYLARRDMEWMGPLYMGLGLTVGAIQSGMESDERQRAYACDITYGTNNEFGFDYLRDNMRPAARDDDRYPKPLQQAQGPLNYAIIDEVDNILIDEARTPLIISGPAHDDVSKYPKADQIARKLERDVHFEVKEKEHTAHLTDEGVRVAEKLADVESFYTAGNMEWPHLIDNALKAHHLYKRDVNYVVQNGEVIIVDEFTGRLMPGRNWSDGLHQAVEAKEGVPIKQENQTLATITLQNFFKLYRKISGMTGTAMTEASEFWKIYKLDVVSIPTNRPLSRINYADVIYRTEREKFQAIVDEIERIHKWDVLELADGSELLGTIQEERNGRYQVLPKDSVSRDARRQQAVDADQVRRISRRGRPVLVGTVSIEKSERLSEMLARKGIPHEVLNAKYHQREAEIVAQAGRKGAVTIATNMAGRGTDIILGGNPETLAWAQLQTTYATRLDVPREEWDALVNEIEEREQMKPAGREVATMGGLHVIGTERHEARRIDLQLRGRCARQGDPGSSRFYLSLEDDLMRIFAGDWVKNVLTRLGMQEGEAIESRMVSRRIEGAQKKVEEQNFERRKSLLEYDEVMDEQRRRVYRYRQQILDGTDCRELIFEMIDQQVDRFLGGFLDPNYGVGTFARWASDLLRVEFDPRDLRNMDFEAAEQFVKDEAERMAETQLLEAMDENLPEDEDPADWNWQALTKMVNARWSLNFRDRELRAAGREGVAELVLEQAREKVQQIDCREGARFLEGDFGIRSACGWVEHKFGVVLDPAAMAKLEPEAFRQLVREESRRQYAEKDVDFPVLAGMYRFSVAESHGQRRFDRDQLAAWAAERFHTTVDVEELRNKPRDELQSLLAEKSREYLKEADRVWADAQRRVAECAAELSRHEANGHAAADGRGLLASLARWVAERTGVQLDVDRLATLDEAGLLAEVRTAVDEHFRPEMRRMERALVLQLLDGSWKDHLLAMDHLRSGVSLRGYAQVDPKVEYKREGMRQFEEMWQIVGQRVTDLVFRVEQLDENWVGSLWVGAKAVHEEAPGASEIAQQQQQAIDGTQSSARPEPIRNRGQHVGRNDPCPCGSGKKFKNCCMRKVA